MTISELLQAAVEQNRSSDTSQLDCELLLCHLLDVDRSWLKTWPDREISSDHQQRFQQLLQRRIEGEPIAHIVGSQGFWTLNLKVSPDTLIPRPETELLVETALELDLPTRARILDLGTGSGAIALALASERQHWQIIGADLVPGAVELAKHNCQRHKLENVTFLQSNWYSDIATRSYDLIVSNPPYIEQGDRHLSEGDVRFEPVSALVSDNGGLKDLDTVIEQGPNYLSPGGWLVVEHGYQQGSAVRELFEQAGFARVETRLDLNGLERITLGWLK